MYRRDPVCIAHRDGSLIATTGNTRELFTRYGVESLNDFLETGDGSPVGTELQRRCADGREESAGTPLYSPVTEKWYNLQIRRGDVEDHFLIWLDDVTARVHLEERRDALRAFTKRLSGELSGDTALQAGRPVADNDQRLARLLLDEGYRVVMLARIRTTSGEGHGTLYHSDGRRLDGVRFNTDSDAPIVRSRTEGRAIWDTRDNFPNADAFRAAYPVLPEVAAFIDEPVHNLANYHSGDVSIIAFNKSGGLTFDDIAVLESVADTAVSAFAFLDLARRIDHRFIQSIHGVCAAAEFSDELTGEHIWRVNRYSRLLAETIGLPEYEVETIGTVAAMHDIGKVAIPHIIKLPRPLTGTERQEMQMHTVYGAQIIDRMRDAADEPDPRLDMAYRIALCHHEEWSGTGYPGLIAEHGERIEPTSKAIATYAQLRPLREDEIPTEALIVSLADKYDALRSARQYKPGFNHDEVVKLLRRDDRSGRTGSETFGPRLFEAFLDTHDRFAEIFAAE